MNRTDFSLRSNRHDGRQAGKRQERIRAHGPTGRVAGAATEMLSGSQPSSSTACPAYVLPRAPVPVRPTLTPRPDTIAGALAAQFHPTRLWAALVSRHSDLAAA